MVSRAIRGASLDVISIFIVTALFVSASIKFLLLSSFYYLATNYHINQAANPQYVINYISDATF